MIEAVLSQYGLAGLVIAVLAGVILYQNKKLDSQQIKLDAIQDQRLLDARETNNRLTEPLEQQARMSDKIYDLLLNSKRGK